jgi:hypothetical protein
MVKICLAELASDVKDIEVDGENVRDLTPTKRLSESSRYETMETLALATGISLRAPHYSGRHQHCQYSRSG